jgi:hypothetical protein
LVSFLELEVLILIFIALLMGAGAIETLRQIRNAIHENYEASLVRAMTQTDITVKLPEKEKIVKPCVCGHAQAGHHARRFPEAPGFDHCEVPDCTCTVYRPKRGPWPGEVKV